MPIRARKMERRVPIHIAMVEEGLDAGRGERQQDLQTRIVAAATGLHDGIAAADVAAGDAGGARGAQQVHDLGVAGGGGQHQGRLVVLVQRHAVALVAGGQQGGADGQEAQRAGQVQGGVGEAGGRAVWVVEQVRVGFQDAV